MIKSYDGYRLYAVYDADWGKTEISARTRAASQALRRVVRQLWPDAEWCVGSWMVAGDHVGEIRAADFSYPRERSNQLERAEIMEGAILSYREDRASYYHMELHYWRCNAPLPLWIRQRMETRIRDAAALDGVEIEGNV